MVVAGEQVVVGDVAQAEGTLDVGPVGTIAYEVLCRRHHVRRLTAAVAAAAGEAASGAAGAEGSVVDVRGERLSGASAPAAPR